MENNQVSYEIMSLTHVTFVYELIEALLISSIDHLHLSLIGCLCANKHVTPMRLFQSLELSALGLAIFVCVF